MVTEIRPTHVRRQLGRRLRKLREQAGRTMEDVITSGVASRTKLWRLEGGRGAVKAGDILVLTRLYEAEPAVVDELLAMAEATKATGYLEDYHTAAVPQAVGLYADLEETAARISVYNSELVPGLLQTASYARAVIEADRSLSSTIVDQRVAFRLERQRRFFARPGTLEVIVPAGVMNLRVGSTSVMEEQIAHLRAVSNEGAARISVLPATNGVHRVMHGPFIILDFDDPDDPSVAYVENVIGSRYIEKPADVAKFRRGFDEIRQLALPLKEWLHVTEPTPWIKANASVSDGECVEMRRNADLIEVRDSKDREGPVLRFTSAEFAAWLDGVRKGEFDHLTPGSSA